MKLTREQLKELEIEGAVEKDGDSAELKGIEDLKRALETQGNVMRAMIAEVQAGIAHKCKYKFTVKRDENKMITELVATPMEGGDGA